MNKKLSAKKEKQNTFLKKLNKSDFNEINIKKELIYLTEEEILFLVDSNNIKNPFYEILVRSYNESVFEDFQNLSRTMVLKNDDTRFFLREHN